VSDDSPASRTLCAVVDGRAAARIAALDDSERRDLLATGRPSAVEVLLLLHDKDSLTRVFAAEGALDLGYSELAPSLAAVAAGDSSRMARAWAGYALGGLLQGRAIPLLRWCQGRERTSWGRAFFAGALLVAGDPGALDLLIPFLGSRSASTRRVVGNSLAEDCPVALWPRAVAALEASLPSQRPWYVRRDLTANAAALREKMARGAGGASGADP
jgi:HEAT repeat protein